MISVSSEYRPQVEDHIRLAVSVAKLFVRGGRVLDSEQYGDALVGLVKASEGYFPEMGEFSTYARKCMINEILNGLKSRRRSEKNIATEDIEIAIEITEDEQDEDSIKKVLHILQTVKDQDLLVQHYLHNISWATIARKLQVSRAAIQQRGDKALRNLREKLQAENSF